MPNDEKQTILVVDDEPHILLMMEDLLMNRYEVITAGNGLEALEIIGESWETLDLVITDIMMPKMDGMGLLSEIRSNFPSIGVIMISAHGNIQKAVEAMQQGAYDYISKPLPEFREMEAKIERYIEKRNLELKLEEYERNKEYATIMGLAKLAEARDPETGEHLLRVENYCRILAQELATFDKYASALTSEVVENLARSSALHDIGKVGIPDAILLKPGRLSDEEWRIMKTHSKIGGDTLAAAESVLNWSEETFLSMARDIAYYHHEWYNGKGYPFGWSGKSIPLSARIVALADGYDAISSKRPYKDALPHETVKEIILEERGKRYDPEVVDAFLTREADFIVIRDKYKEKG